MEDLGGAVGGYAAFGLRRREGERLVGVVGGGDEGGCGFEGDAGEGREGDCEGGEDVGDWKGEGVGFAEGVGGEDGEEEKVLLVGDRVLVGD